MYEPTHKKEISFSQKGRVIAVCNPNLTQTQTQTLLPPSLLPQIKFGLVPADSDADLEEEDPAWATRVVRFGPEYKFALTEAMGAHPQLSRHKMPHLMAQIVRAVVNRCALLG